MHIIMYFMSSPVRPFFWKDTLKKSVGVFLVFIAARLGLVCIPVELQ
jgi:hypothetical protein